MSIFHIFESKGYSSQYGMFRTRAFKSSRTQVSGRGPTLSITRGSFFATAGGEVSGIASGDDDDDDDDASAVAAASPTGRL